MQDMNENDRQNLKWSLLRMHAQAVYNNPEKYKELAAISLGEGPTLPGLEKDPDSVSLVSGEVRLIQRKLSRAFKGINTHEGRQEKIRDVTKLLLEKKTSPVSQRAGRALQWAYS
jgi:hypothetical protein